jgi:periplasmic copper chaperone A
MTRSFFLPLAALTSAVVAAPVIAQAYRVGDVTVSQAWSRETAPGQQVGGAFMTITNRSKVADRLVSGSSSQASEVQVHTVSIDGGVMRMRQLVDGLEIPAGGTVMLRPGSFHIMLIGLRQPLARGSHVPVTLRFSQAGRVTVRLAVQAIGSTGPAEAAHAGH